VSSAAWFALGAAAVLAVQLAFAVVLFAAGSRERRR